MIYNTVIWYVTCILVLPSS